ncbi:N-lysine methyltransferase KMT5A, partial [Frankliniella fusca]
DRHVHKLITSPLKRRILNKNKNPVPLRLLLNIEDGLKVVQIPNKGRGVLATRKFFKNEFVIEYRGQLITRKEGITREKKLPRNTGCYFLYFKHKEKPIIDATEETEYKGRLINHGLPPNIKPKVYCMPNCAPRVGFVALREINPQEELVFDYGERRPDIVGAYPWLKSHRRVTDKKTKIDQSKPSIVCQIPLWKVAGLFKLDHLRGAQDINNTDNKATDVNFNNAESNQDENVKVLQNPECMALNINETHSIQISTAELCRLEKVEVNEDIDITDNKATDVNFNNAESNQDENVKVLQNPECMALNINETHPIQIATTELCRLEKVEVNEDIDITGFSDDEATNDKEETCPIKPKPTIVAADVNLVEDFIKEESIEVDYVDKPDSSREHTGLCELNQEVVTKDIAVTVGDTENKGNGSDDEATNDKEETCPIKPKPSIVAADVNLVEDFIKEESIEVDYVDKPDSSREHTGLCELNQEVVTKDIAATVGDTENKGNGSVVDIKETSNTDDRTLDNPFLKRFKKLRTKPECIDTIKNSDISSESTLSTHVLFGDKENLRNDSVVDFKETSNTDDRTLDNPFLKRFKMLRTKPECIDIKY